MVSQLCGHVVNMQLVCGHTVNGQSAVWLCQWATAVCTVLKKLMKYCCMYTVVVFMKYCCVYTGFFVCLFGFKKKKKLWNTSECIQFLFHSYGLGPWCLFGEILLCIYIFGCCFFIPVARAQGSVQSPLRAMVWHEQQRTWKDHFVDLSGNGSTWT